MLGTCTFSRLLAAIPSSSLTFADSALDELVGFSFSTALTIGERVRSGDRGLLLLTMGERGRGERYRGIGDLLLSRSL